MFCRRPDRSTPAPSGRCWLNAYDELVRKQRLKLLFVVWKVGGHKLGGALAIRAGRHDRTANFADTLFRLPLAPAHERNTP